MIFTYVCKNRFLFGTKNARSEKKETKNKGYLYFIKHWKYLFNHLFMYTKTVSVRISLQFLHISIFLKTNTLMIHFFC